LETKTCATVPSVGNPPSISRAGAGACRTRSSQLRHPYLGRRTTSTRNCAGTMSRRSPVSRQSDEGHCHSTGNCGLRYRPPFRCVADAQEAIRGSCGAWWYAQLAQSDWPPQSRRRCSPRPARRLRARVTSDLQATSRRACQNDDAQFLNDLAESIVLYALGNQHRPQRAGIVGKRIGENRHADTRSCVTTRRELFCIGAGVSRAA
jgi:hypothetical protein